MPPLPKCPACMTRRWTKRIKDDWFHCSYCGSVWLDKGFSQKERLERFCPICNQYVEYDNWHPYIAWLPGDKGVSKNFHHECWEKHRTEVEEYQKWLHEEIVKQELIATFACPVCGEEMAITTSLDVNDVIYMCQYCNAEISEEWINQKIGEVKDARN